MWDGKIVIIGGEKSKDNRDLIVPCVIAPIFSILQLISEKYIFPSIGTWLGVSDQKRKAAPRNPKLEKAFSVSQKWKYQEIAKEVAMSEDEVKKWLRLKLSEKSPTNLTKFSECSWNFCLASGIAISTFMILWDKPWFWDVSDCWRNHYNQPATSDVWWYYKIYFGHRFSQLCSLCFQVKRKDFGLFIIHHVVLVVGLLLSWKSNGLAYLSLLLLVHDWSDPFLEGAKLLKYLRYNRTTNVAFVMFAFSWILGRLVIFPFYLFASFLVDLPNFWPYVTNNYFYYVYVAMHCTFLLLNIIWTYFILKVVCQLFVRGQVEDIRSDDED